MLGDVPSQFCQYSWSVPLPPGLCTWNSSPSLACPWDGVSYKISGINHMAWLLEISRNGEDLYPIIRKRAQEGPIYAPTLALRELHPEYADRIPSVASSLLLIIIMIWFASKS